VGLRVPVVVAVVSNGTESSQFPSIRKLLAKTFHELTKALKWGVGLINVDSLNELQKLMSLSKKHDFLAKVCIRVNVAFFGQKWNKFGMTKKDAMRACKLLSKSENLKYVGLHAHLGTQVGSTRPYKRLIKYMVGVSKELKEKYGLITYFMNIGGGFSVPSLPPLHTKHKISKPNEFAEAIATTLKTEIAKHGLELPYLVLEPGRILVSSPIVLLLKVIAIKSLQNVGKIILVDGGLNILPESEYYQYKIVPVVIRGSSKTRAQIAGPLCMQEDVIGRDRILSPIKQNDILAVLDAGGYSATLSWQFIKTKPAVVLIGSDDKTRLIRKAESTADALRPAQFPYKVRAR